MSAKTGIQWTDHTFNPWWGCTKVSPGCTNCYAERDAMRYGHKVWGPDAPRRFFGDKHWREPLRWDIAAMKDGVRRRVFCASMADVFEETGNPGVDFRLDAERRNLYRVIQYTPHLDWLLLTKRPENVRRMAPFWPGWPPNVRVGVSVENQDYLRRAAVLFESGAPHPWISYEPALGPLDLFLGNTLMLPLEWVIVGGESGPGARPFDIAWGRSVVKQCRAAGVAVFVKQVGAMPVDPGVTCPTVMECPCGLHFGFRDRKGGDMSEWPEDLRVREFPR